MIPPQVKCPSCDRILETPANSPVFLCPCGTRLTVGTRQRSGSSNSTQHRSTFDSSSVQQQQPQRQTPSTSITSRIFRAFQNSPLPANTDPMAQDPPTYTPDESRDDCQHCGRLFTIVRRKHHCRNCGALVCGDCSQSRWPAAMLPDSYNLRNEKWMRICKVCHEGMEKFRMALLGGQYRDALALYDKFRIQVHCPYQIYQRKMYPIHCAAAGGSIECISWLVTLGCKVDTKDSIGWTPLCHAADNDKVLIMRWLIIALHCSVDEITDIATLQRNLHNAIVLLPNPNSNGVMGVAPSSNRRFSAPDTPSQIPVSPPPPTNPDTTTTATTTTSAENDSAPSAPDSASEPPPPYSTATSAETESLADRDASARDILLRTNENESSAEGARNSQLLVPNNEEEELEQLRMALAVSSATSMVDDVHDTAQVLPPQFLTREQSLANKSRTASGISQDQESLQEADECVICFSNPVDTVFVPCGHYCCCHECGSDFTECPVCRQDITQVVKTFKSSC